MRSPVRIWIAAPKASTSKSQDFGVFFVFSTGAAVCCILLVVHSVQFLRKLSSGPSIDVLSSLLYN
jgi:hypothetical protein